MDIYLISLIILFIGYAIILIDIIKIIIKKERQND